MGNVRGKRRLQHQRCAVLEAHEAGREILDGEIAAVPLTAQADDVFAMSELCLGLARHRNRLREVHQPERQV